MFKAYCLHISSHNLAVGELVSVFNACTMLSEVIYSKFCFISPADLLRISDSDIKQFLKQFLLEYDSTYNIKVVGHVSVLVS